MTLTEIKDKIISGDLKSLFYKGTQTDIHPADVAKILNTLPPDVLFKSFTDFPEKKKDHAVRLHRPLSAMPAH